MTAVPSRSDNLIEAVLLFADGVYAALDEELWHTVEELSSISDAVRKEADMWAEKLPYHINLLDIWERGHVAVRVMEPGRNVRLTLKGTCNPGDVLVLADTGTAADKGKVRALPASAGTYRGLAIAEEKGADGQLVLCRPAMIGNVVVSG